MLTNVLRITAGGLKEFGWIKKKLELNKYFLNWVTDGYVDDVKWISCIDCSYFFVA